MEPVRVALAGNPNSGKTTLFNAMTGARQHVGNWGGVTVEVKTGRARFSGRDLAVTDLPGTYSLSAQSAGPPTSSSTSSTPPTSSATCF
jgi:ferrous iron transport protein B